MNTDNFFLSNLDAFYLFIYLFLITVAKTSNTILKKAVGVGILVLFLILEEKLSFSLVAFKVLSLSLTFHFNYNVSWCVSLNSTYLELSGLLGAGCLFPSSDDGIFYPLFIQIIFLVFLFFFWGSYNVNIILLGAFPEIFWSIFTF